MNYRAWERVTPSIFFLILSQSIEVGRENVVIFLIKHAQKKRRTKERKKEKRKRVKLTERKMEPVLLVQTRVPGGLGSQNKGKGMGGVNVETWKGKCQLGITWRVSKQPRHEKLSQASTPPLFTNHFIKEPLKNITYTEKRCFRVTRSINMKLHAVFSNNLFMIHTNF